MLNVGAMTMEFASAGCGSSLVCSRKRWIVHLGSGKRERIAVGITVEPEGISWSEARRSVSGESRPRDTVRNTSQVRSKERVNLEHWGVAVR